jgi:hypothetical protein
MCVAVYYDYMFIKERLSAEAKKLKSAYQFRGVTKKVGALIFVWRSFNDKAED